MIGACATLAEAQKRLGVSHQSIYTRMARLKMESPWRAGRVSGVAGTPVNPEDPLVEE